jgi:hypothetical protein
LSIELLVEASQHAVRAALETKTDLAASRSPHQFHKLSIDPLWVNDAPKSEVEFGLYHLTAKVLYESGRKVESVIDEVEVSVSNLPQFHQPLYDSARRTASDRFPLDYTGRTEGAVQRTTSPALHRHPELAFVSAGRNPKTGLWERQIVQVFFKVT